MSKLDYLVTNVLEVKKELPQNILKDYVYVLEALCIRLDRLSQNKNLSYEYQFKFENDTKLIKSVIDDLKYFI